MLAPIVCFIALPTYHSAGAIWGYRSPQRDEDAISIAHRSSRPSDPRALLFPRVHQPKEEAQLTAAVDAEPWDTTWKRRRQLYSWSYGHGEGQPRPIPPWGLALAERMHCEGISDRPFDQMLINEYLPGQGISLHRDYESFDRTVVSLSLHSPCVMDFRHAKDGQVKSKLLERRSLLVLSDEARYAWQHGIAARKKDRWQGEVIPRARRLSITFRLRKQSK